MKIVEPEGKEKEKRRELKRKKKRRRRIGPEIVPEARIDASWWVSAGNRHFRKEQLDESSDNRK